MVAASLVGDQPETTGGIPVTGSDPAEVDHGSQILLLHAGRRADGPGCHRVGDSSVEQHRGQFDRMAWQHPSVEAVEPADRMSYQGPSSTT